MAVDYTRVLSIGGPVVLEVLRFAAAMRKVHGPSVTDEQIAEAWQESKNAFLAMAEKWEDETPS